MNAFRIEKRSSYISTNDGQRAERLSRENCFVYLDDIVGLLLRRLRETGLKLQPDKCEYLRPELEYLGNLITAKGVKPNPANTESVKSFK